MFIEGSIILVYFPNIGFSIPTKYLFSIRAIYKFYLITIVLDCLNKDFQI